MKLRIDTSFTDVLSYSDKEIGMFLRIIPDEEHNQFILQLLTGQELNEELNNPKHKKGYVIPILSEEQAKNYE